MINSHHAAVIKRVSGGLGSSAKIARSLVRDHYAITAWEVWVALKELEGLGKVVLNNGRWEIKAKSEAEHSENEKADKPGTID